jgi:hypothetical protein
MPLIDIKQREREREKEREREREAMPVGLKSTTFFFQYPRSFRSLKVLVI